MYTFVFIINMQPFVLKKSSDICAPLLHLYVAVLIIVSTHIVCRIMKRIHSDRGTLDALSVKSLY